MDPYLKVLQAFQRKKVRYVVVGVSGINYYSRSALQVIMTADFDIFVNPDFPNVLKAVQILRAQGYRLSADGKSLPAVSNAVKGALNGLQTIQAQDEAGHLIELCLNVSGYTFDQLESDVKVFQAKKIKVYVPKLDKLLKMKEIAGRPKDKIFLERYRLINPGQ